MVIAAPPVETRPAKPMAAIVVMGVSGSGKTTIAAVLAQELNAVFEDADWFHSQANLDKMHRGLPLTDEDRWPWLDAIAASIERMRRSGLRVVIACSALKRAYRHRLVGNTDDVLFVYLKGDKDLIAKRLALRAGHFMPAGLLDSQFATLEEPGADENPIVVSIDAAPREIIDDILRKMGLRVVSAPALVGDAQI